MGLPSLDDFYQELGKPGFLWGKEQKEIEQLALEVATFDQSDGKAADLLERLLRGADDKCLGRIWSASKERNMRVLELAAVDECERRKRHRR